MTIVAGGRREEEHARLRFAGEFEHVAFEFGLAGLRRQQPAARGDDVTAQAGNARDRTASA